MANTQPPSSNKDSSVRRIWNRLRSKVSLPQSVRRRPWIGAVVGAGVVLIVGGFVWAVHSGRMHVPRSLKHPLAAVLTKTPEDKADERVSFGHSQFEAGNREAGIRAYDRALSIDRKILNASMIDDLVACFGHKEQGDAASVLTRHKVVEAKERLDRLSQSKEYRVRWAALQTLERLGKANRADFIKAWTLDLESSDCDVRKRAMQSLGDEGDKRALNAIYAANDKELAGKAPKCLGQLPAEAEKKILAHK